MKKPIINQYLAKISSIINKLFAVVEEKHDVQDYIKLVLLFESFSPEFNQWKGYILINQNITLKKVVTFLASNEVQIFRNYVIKLEIKAIVIIARIK